MKCSICILCGSDKLQLYDYNFYQPNGMATIVFNCDACGKYTRARYQLTDIAPMDYNLMREEYANDY